MVGILFDLDGTLLDTLEDLCDGVNHALDAHGYPRRSLEEVRDFVGNGAGMLIRRAVDDAGDWEAVLATFRAYYDAHCQVKTQPYRGVPDMLQALQKVYPVAIVSNKPDSAVKALCGQYFPGVYALGESSLCPRKPAPDMVYRAMEALGVSGCVYVGDSEVDVLTAKNAAVPCLSVLWGFRDRQMLAEAGARWFCREPKQLPGMIERIVEEQYGK